MDHTFTQHVIAATQGINSLVEIGAMIGEELKPLDHIPHRLGVEKFAPYLDHWIADGVPAVAADGLAWLRGAATNSWECVMFVDVLEHMEKQIGLECLQEAKRVASKMLLAFVPDGPHAQHHKEVQERFANIPQYMGLAQYDNPLQDHISTWTTEDFPRWKINQNALPGGPKSHKHILATLTL